MNNKNLEKAKIFFTEGLKFLQEENYQEAEIKFIKSLDLSPSRLSIIHNLISIYINTDQKYKLKKLLENYKNLSEEKEILYGKAFSFYFENNYLDSIAVILPPPFTNSTAFLY